MSSPMLQPQALIQTRSGASMIQLPPSPDLKAAAATLQQSIEFSLDSTTNSVPGGPTTFSQDLPTRLRSVARYQAFHPRALACSNTLTSTFHDDESTGNANNNIHSSTHLTSSSASNKVPPITTTTTTSTHASKDPGPSSLGAVAGPRGVALFRLSRPHVPLLILSHATNATSLAFQPTSSNEPHSNSPRSMYLAAARGSGVLVWDASGHTPSPLVGRLANESSSSTWTASGGVNFDLRLTSIAWKPHTLAPLLAATTSTSLSLWDLRSAPRGSTSATTSNSFKPSLRFGTTRKVTHSSVVSPLVQVACSSRSDECATIDASGVVRVYDVRMAERNRSSAGAWSVFTAFESAGVGISHFDSHSTRTADGQPDRTGASWLTWGLDSTASSATVKIWSSSNSHQGNHDWADPDDVEGGSPGRSKTAILESPPDYHLVARCARPHLACARVCASPVEESFMAVGHVPRMLNRDYQASGGGWWAELYKLDVDNAPSAVRKTTPGQTGTTFGAQKVVAFQGGSTEADRSLTSVLGTRTDYGELQAAELAFSATTGLSSALAGTSFRQRSGDDSAPHGSEDERHDVDLLLCCLSSTGIVTTHAVPEAKPRVNLRHQQEAQNRTDGSPTRQVLRTAFAGTMTRVYPEDKEGTSLADAAGFWSVGSGGASGTGGETGTSRNSGGGVFWGGVEDARAAADQPSTPPKVQHGEGGDPMLPSQRRISESGIMPFDMDVPVAYGSVTAGSISGVQIGVTDMSSGNVVTAAGMGALEEGDQVAVDVRDTIMENIETERVPCPRLCGATFGSGNGGLAIFHNGDVKKMWSWFKRADNIRGAHGPKSDAAFSDTEGLGVATEDSLAKASNPIAPQLEEATSQSQTHSRLGPKSLKELMNMISTAKKAQWGERNGSVGSGSDESLSPVENFFEEDDSLGDSNSSESGDEGPSTPPPASDMYEMYFGGEAWKIGAVGEKLETARRNAPDPELATMTKMRSFAGPSLDMLAPVVRVTHDYDALVLNNQNIQLARDWKLGGWNTSPAGSLPDPSNHTSLPVGQPEERRERSKDAGFRSQLTPPRRAGFPQRHPLISPTNEHRSLPRTRSDPNLNKAARQTPKNLNFRQDEGGVHGGVEYSSRPNVEESMTFLRKLFTHQQGGTTFPTLMSPPDSPLLSNRFAPSSKRSSSTGRLQHDATILRLQKNFQASESAAPRDTQAVRLGVYSLSPAWNSDDESEMEELETMEQICLHNAAVCESIGETEKQSVWNLLAQTVESKLCQRDNILNGWGSVGTGALGVDLVSSLLRFYESLGDVQMLATMFCVLSGSNYRSNLHARPFFLPQGQDERFDAYIRRYAELLYGWGLLSVRAELNKHLLRIPGELSMEENVETGRAPGIAVVFQCPRCGRDADFNTNICRTCQDYAFRCSICDNAVLGLFTVCDICSHGGHVEHMKSWFAEHVECPTGCGCNCVFSIQTPSPEVGTCLPATIKGI